MVNPSIIINLFIHYVEELCKTSCKRMCKLIAKICVKNLFNQNQCKTKLSPQCFPNFFTNFFTYNANLLLSNTFHISTHPTITTTNILNSNI